MRVPLNRLVAEARYQPRSHMDPETVRNYSEKMRAGAIFPPVLVGKREKSYVLLDGWHRIAAAERAGLDAVEVRVTAEPEAKWLLLVFQENANHGLALTPTEVHEGMKRLAAAKVPEAEIANVFRVRVETVARVLRPISRDPAQYVQRATNTLRPPTPPAIPARPIISMPSPSLPAASTASPTTQPRSTPILPPPTPQPRVPSMTVMADAGIPSTPIIPRLTADDLHEHLRTTIRLLDDYHVEVTDDIGTMLLVQLHERIAALLKTDHQ